MHTLWTPQWWMALPFVGLLLSIAILPVRAPHFWHRIRNQCLIGMLFSLPIFLLYLIRSNSELWLTLQHYLSFVLLLGSLYIVSGGILITGHLTNTPAANTALLGVGCILSNILGTTGASMILIRPFLRANQNRKHHVHLPLFFIMLVSNISGLLTPLGDPPLFLGYLRGVPFFWTLKLFPFWILAVSILLTAFYAMDRWFFCREPQSELSQIRDSFSIVVRGKRNLGSLALVLAAIFLPMPYREILMFVGAVISLKVTPEAYHKENDFSFYPIKEVAVLFLAIFITMIPALELLHLHGSALGIKTPGQFFWSTGIFSSVLDNAPTYLTFIALGQGLGLTGPLLGMPEKILIAISVGAVFFGSLTYIGNAPNFMVRSIAVRSGWKMPSFFGYIQIAAAILLPLFVVITMVLLR